MTVNERVIEIPWALMQLPQTGVILDIGSCGASYLAVLQTQSRTLNCMDSIDCADQMPPGAIFHHQNLIGNCLPAHCFDGVMLLSVIEHVGLACYGNTPFANGDRLALAEIRRLLKPGGTLVATMPAGRLRATSWYRQYSPRAIHDLFNTWEHAVAYWGFDGQGYHPIAEAEVEAYDYRDHPYVGAGAGAVAGVVAHPIRRGAR